MRRSLALVLCLGISLLPLAGGLHVEAAGEQAGTPEKPIWANGATVLDLSCTSHTQTIASPDYRSSVTVVCTNHEDSDPTFALQILAPNGHRSEMPLDQGAHELLWAPNSNSFFVNGGTSAYAGFFVSVYLIEPSTGVRKETITGAAQKDMVSSFPPCKAWNRDENICGRIADDPEYNMSALAWTDDSSAVYVFAEVPCSSTYGGIMCQVLGYELSVPTGRILKRLSARATKEQWSKYTAWEIRIPEPPKYGPAHVTW